MFVNKTMAVRSYWRHSEIKDPIWDDVWSYSHHRTVFWLTFSSAYRSLVDRCISLGRFNFFTDRSAILVWRTGELMCKKCKIFSVFPFFASFITPSFTFHGSSFFKRNLINWMASKTIVFIYKTIKLRIGWIMCQCTTIGTVISMDMRSVFFHLINRTLTFINNMSPWL